MIDVLDNLRPLHARELPLLDVFARETVAFEKLASFVFAAALLHFFADGFVDFGFGFLGVAKFLTKEADVVVDLDDAALCGQVHHHLVGHVARSVAKSAAGRDRKSTRLNSSHRTISYAVFCLKKK